jgi:hypothetical protein
MTDPPWLEQLRKEGRVSDGPAAVALPAPEKVSHQGGRAIRKSDGMNKTEARYAREELEPLKRVGKIINYWYEPVNFKLADKTHYTPDFMVVAHDLTVSFTEVKGRKGDGPWVEEDAICKVKVAAKMYPFLFSLVWPLKGGGWTRRDY